MEDFPKFLKAEEVEKLVDLDPNKPHTDWDVLAAVSKVFKAELKSKKSQREADISGQNACKKTDVSIQKITSEGGNAASLSDDDEDATQLSGSKSVLRGNKLALHGFMPGRDVPDAAKISPRGIGGSMGRGSSKLKQTTLDATVIVGHSGRSTSAAETASGRSIATQKENTDSVSSDEAVEYGVTEVHESSALCETKKKQLVTSPILDVLIHACTCESKACPNTICGQLRRLFNHSSLCKVRVRGGCEFCKKVWLIMSEHSKICRDSDCKVPRCMDVKNYYIAEQEVAAYTVVEEVRRSSEFS